MSVTVEQVVQERAGPPTDLWTATFLPVLAVVALVAALAVDTAAAVADGAAVVDPAEDGATVEVPAVVDPV